MIGRRMRAGAVLAATAMAGALACSLPAGATGPAYTVEVAEFVVSVSDGEGNERSAVANVVPFLPERACFGWRLRLAGAPAVVRVREVLQLPEAPAFWSGEDDAYSTHTFSADRTTAITEEYKAPRDGWLESSWCIVEGDPAGPHSIDVYIDGSLARHFDFEVKKLGDTTGN
ncbi:MAG: hypothetical protein Kow00114_15880 [Kiloniellaceae bacterium]